MGTVVHGEAGGDTVSGTLEAGASTTETVTREFTTPGVFRFGPEDALLTVDVTELVADEQPVATDSPQPGFGPAVAAVAVAVAVAVAAVAAVAVLAHRR